MNNITIQTMTMQPLDQFSAVPIFTIFLPIDEVTTLQIFIGACALSLNLFILLVMLSQCSKTPWKITEKMLCNQLVLDGLVGLTVVMLRALRFGQVFKNSSIERLLCTVNVSSF